MLSSGVFQQQREIRALSAENCSFVRFKFSDLLLLHALNFKPIGFSTSPWRFPTRTAPDKAPMLIAIGQPVHKNWSMHCSWKHSERPARSKNTWLCPTVSGYRKISVNRGPNDKPLDSVDFLKYPKLRWTLGLAIYAQCAGIEIIISGKSSQCLRLPAHGAWHKRLINARYETILGAKDAQPYNTDVWHRSMQNKSAHFKPGWSGVVWIDKKACQASKVEHAVWDQTACNIFLFHYRTRETHCMIHVDPRSSLITIVHPTSHLF